MTPAAKDHWPVWKLALLLYPFAASAVAINLFLLGLIAASAGWPGLVLTPVQAVVFSLPLGLPATWAAGRWVRHLLDEAAR
jgi:hypothetical protein